MFKQKKSAQIACDQISTKPLCSAVKVGPSQSHQKSLESRINVSKPKQTSNMQKHNKRGHIT